MRGLDIESLLTANLRTKLVFRGVFAIDTLPDCITIVSANAYVINQDPSHRPGSHWVALFITPFGRAIYMDSFGRPPNQTPIIHCTSLVYNKTSIQSLISGTCGLYCVYFIRQMCSGSTIQRFLAQFKPYEPEYNDRRITRLV